MTSCATTRSLTDINGIRVLSRLGRSTRSSWAPHRHDSDACAFTRALYRGGRNHVGPANVLSCASRLQDPSPRHARRNRVYFRPKNGRRRLTLPRPRLVCVLALLDKYERMDKDERKKELPRFDGRLRDAVTDDMAAYVGEVMSSVAFRGGLRGRQNQTALSEGARGVEGVESRARLPRQAQGKHALWMAAQERLLHLVLARRGDRTNYRRTPVQAGRNALAHPQRRMRLRHHRQTALRSMRTAAMDDYFFNKIKSHPCPRRAARRGGAGTTRTV